MGLVPVKNVEQRSVLSSHRVRQVIVKARPAQANRIRGLLGEYGRVVPQGIRLGVSELTADVVDAETYFPEPDMLGSAAYIARMHFGIHKHVRELYGDR